MGATIREDRWTVNRVSVDLASVAANTTAEQTISLPGLRLGDIVIGNGLARTAGLSLGGARVSADNTLTVTIGNATAAPIDQTSMDMDILIFRPEKVTYGNVVSIP